MGLHDENTEPHEPRTTAEVIDRRQLNGPANWPSAHPDERFIRHIGLEGDCWVWLGSTTRGGYGRFQLGSTLVYAHRYAYEVEVGAIPDGYEIDHLCRNRACVRPEHLEAVTRQENCRRAGLARRGVLRGPTEGTRVSVMRDTGSTCRFGGYGAAVRGASVTAAEPKPSGLTHYRHTQANLAAYSRSDWRGNRPLAGL